MINAILKYPVLYRLYQKSVRSPYSEYDFIRFIFSTFKNNQIRMLDLCCGDSFILNFVSDFIGDYLGADYSDKYISYSKNKWGNFKFLQLDLNEPSSLEKLKSFNPNFIFVNGALHHLDNETVKNINNLINEFDKSFFLSVDPVKHENKLMNKIMIYFDRGKYIRSKNDYSELMSNCQNLVIDDFYKMSFKSIFHYKNFDLKNLYSLWKEKIGQ
tara:strand:+ start:475 stop:1116 length:642 start_codon:yes stop_codon:yes gene_type:complete